MSGSVVPVSECDYLEEDAEIRGQKFCCVSFLSPEKVLDDKKVFTFTKFTENFCKEVNETLVHFFYDCNVSKRFWDDVFSWLSDISDINIRLSKIEVLLGLTVVQIGRAHV